MKPQTHTKVFHTFNVSIATLLGWMLTEQIQIGKDVAAIKQATGCCARVAPGPALPGVVTNSGSFANLGRMPRTLE